MRFRLFTALAIGLLITGVLAASSSNISSAGGPVGLARAVAVQEANTDRLIGIQGVVGTAVGFGDGGGHVVLALTEVPGVRGIPGSIDGVAVRPYVTGEIKAQPKPGSGFDTTARHRPAPIGVSIGHPAITAGTLGAIVTKNSEYYVLSNNHVLANENFAILGEAAIQPGSFDGGSITADTIATLSEYENIVFSTSANNVVDAAIAKIEIPDGGNVGNVVSQGTPADGYGIPSSTPVDATIGMNVRKYGRTTQQTDGQIDAINATVNVGYDSGTAKFVNQVIIKGRKGAFSQGGDSGSLIVAKDGNYPVALLFAGSNSITIGNPIGSVLAAFGVSIYGDGTPPVTNSVPDVNITSPADGAEFELPLLPDGTSASTVSVTLSGTANDAENGVLTGSIDWTSSLVANSLGTGGSVPNVALGLGTHVITASATDLDGANGSFSVTVTVIDPNAPVVTMIADVEFWETRRGPHTDLNFMITVKKDVNVPVPGAAIDADIFRDGASWDVSGTTNSSGQLTSQIRNARVDTAYTVRVNDVVLSGHDFTPTPHSEKTWLVGSGLVP